ncbi:MAG: M23 family metallopeptidase [Bacteroidia bacterium]|nr:M23 family metallopeptidase [Bacteroidia bacterium]
MKKEHFVIDKNLRIKASTRSAWHVLKSVLKYAVATVSLAVFYYVVFALVISTDSEKRLIKENRLYEKTYQDMLDRERLLSDAIDGLSVKDNQIYDEIFHAPAPVMDPLLSEGYLSVADSIPDAYMVQYAAQKVASVEEVASRVEANFRKIMEIASSPDAVIPPLSLPLKDVSYAQVGASVGMKMNPFYKVESMHQGLDFIAPQGDPVIAAGSGVVSDVIMSRKGLGNVVEITHSGGYVTRYAHLADITVSKGQKVALGKTIAKVGISGNSFAPHLHFEVLKDGVQVDPVDYFYGSVTPDEYTGMKFMASRTGQSLD